MKTLTLTDDQFDTLFEFVDQKVEYIVDKSVDYQDSEILDEWDDLIDVHYQNSAGCVPVQEVAHRHFRKDLALL